MGAACCHCMAISDTLVRCKCCQRAKYCNKQCQVNDWKCHKYGCRKLKTVRETFYPMLKDRVKDDKDLPNLPAFLKATVDETIPAEKKKQWDKSAKFLIFLKTCMICGKNEYDFGADRNWTNCPTCRFGWCCSQDHFQEALSAHTPQVCESYQRATACRLFRWNHCKRYGEEFIFGPESPLTMPFSGFPSSWEEYYETRCPLQHQKSRQGILPLEFLPAATKQLSQPVMCLYSIYQHDFLREKYTSSGASAQELTIHVVGANSAFELWPRQFWEEILHCLPSVSCLNVDFIGPEVAIDSPRDALECCPKCTSQHRSRTVAFHCKTYHDYKSDEATFTPPDLLVAFNTGLSEECRASWKASLQVILDMNVPALFTAYQKDEAEKEFAILQNLGANLLCDEPLLNPFRVDELDIEPGFFYNCGKEPFYQNSMYCCLFRGRR